MWTPLASAATAAPALLISILTQLAPLPALAQEDPIFAFVPPGGRSLLTGLLDDGVSDQDIIAMLASDRDAAGWLDWLQSNRDTLHGLAMRDEWELGTLAAYLDNTAPLTIDATGEALREALPQDGRDLIMRHCQSCHIITVTVTQDRPREAWQGTLGNPSHVKFR